jgi:hypothetical protein
MIATIEFFPELARMVMIADRGIKIDNAIA